MAKAKHYSELSIKDWNTKHFIDFMSTYHKERLGVTYTPVGGYQADAGTMGTLVGTAKKTGLYEKELIYEWIKRCIDTYPPTAQYPGINLRFMYTYKQNILQQLEKEYQRASAAKADSTQDIVAMEEWV